MLQAAYLSRACRQTCIQGFSLLARKGVAKKAPITLRPAGHNHPGIQTAGQRNSDLGSRFKITRQNPFESLLKLGFKGFGRKSRLSLPGVRRKIFPLVALPAFKRPD